MATAPALPQVSVEEYLRTDYEPRCEYLDGVLVPKALADLTHSKLQMMLMMLINSQSQRYGIEALADLHLRVTPSTWRIPDVSVLSVPPADGKYPDDTTPPLFTIEIVSLDEFWASIRGKLADHLAMGVATVIIADPYDKTVMVAAQSEPLHELTSPLVVNIPVPGAGVLPIDFDDLYRQLGQ